MSLSIQHLTVLSSMVLMQCAAWAQGPLRDPTLPPPGAVLAVPGGEALPAEVAAQQAAAATQSSVQMVLVGPSRKFAVIDGQMLKPGGQIDQWRLTSITAKGVVLKSDTGAQTISAYPSVQKKVLVDKVPAPLLKNRNP